MNTAIPDDIKALCLEAGAREDCPHRQRAAITAYLATGDYAELMYESTSIAPYIEDARTSPWFDFSHALFCWAVDVAYNTASIQESARSARKRLPPIPSPS